ncbi:DNA-binding protein [Bordetella pertussis]|nr:DNA-binding protein [Bordetella pertussis]
MRWRGISSQNQLARISGVPQSTIHRILARGDAYAPTRATLERLARALHTTVPWLSDGMLGTIAALCHELGIKHRFTRPYRPQTNGKAERFIQSALREWAYAHTSQNLQTPSRCHEILATPLQLASTPTKASGALYPSPYSTWTNTTY